MGLYVQQSQKRVFQGICTLALVVSLVAPSLSGIIPSRTAYAADNQPVAQVDDEAPQIEIHKNSPDNGSIIDGDKVSTSGQNNKFEFKITDNIPNGVKSVTVTMTNRKTKTTTNFTPKQHTKNKDLWILAFNPTSQLPDGTYDITIKATDLANNEATRGNYFVIIDNDAPVGTITAPTDGAYLHNTVTLSGRVDDATADSYRFYITDETNALRADSGELPHNATDSWSWDTTKLGQDGVYAINFTAKDKLGRLSAVKTIKVTVDNTAPGAPIINTIDSNANPSRTITGTGEANATVAISLDSGVSQTVPVAANGTWSATFDGLSVQPYTATAYAIDKVDNHSGTTSASFAVTELVVPVPPRPTPTPIGIDTSAQSDDGFTLKTTPPLIVKGLIEPNQTKKSFNYGFNVADTTDGSLDAAVLQPDSSDDQAVKGESIFGDSPESIAAVAPSTQGWKVLGIAWYWWMAALLGIGLAVWQLSASLHRRLQKQEV